MFKHIFCSSKENILSQIYFCNNVIWNTFSVASTIINDNMKNVLIYYSMMLYCKNHHRKNTKMVATWRRWQNPVMFRLFGTSTRILVMPEESHAGLDSSNITTILIEVPRSLNMTRFCRHRHITSVFVFLRWCFVCVNTISCRWNLWNENSSLQKKFLNWYYDNAQQGLYTESNGMGREQDSRDRERERERGRASLKMRDRVGNKFDHRRKYLCQIWESNLKQSRCR